MTALDYIARSNGREVVTSPIIQGVIEWNADLCRRVRVLEAENRDLHEQVLDYIVREAGMEKANRLMHRAMCDANHALAVARDDLAALRRQEMGL